MSLDSLQRWHTDPKEPDFYPDGKKTALYLNNEVGSGSYAPLYNLIEERIKSLKSDKNASESLFWLQSLLDNFDLYVTQELHRVHYALWAREWEIRQEYEQHYGKKPDPAWNIRAVMARLMTFKEIQKYVKDETFWHRPETRPVYSLDCLSGGIINDQTRPWKYVTGINPVHPRRGYMLTYEKPWIGKQLDPMHHWGVYMDKKLLGISDRYFMACCGELVGQTEGCWINLPEAKTKGAIEGVIQPYQLFPTVFNNVWENYVRNNSFPAADQIKEDYNIGTAFRDITKYDNLHKEIQSSWANASKIIPESFKSYAKLIQDHLDANDSDAGRETNPFENPAVLTPQGRIAIETPIQLVLRYNEIQCMGALVPPLIRDYVNEKIFRVADMLASFTYERMGGIEYTKTDGSKERIKMLKTDIDNTAQIDTMIKQIDQSTDKPALKTVIKPALTALKTKITERMAENARRVRLANTRETLKEMRQAKMDQVMGVTGLNWQAVVAALNLFDTNDQILLDREKEINDSLRSFRSPGGFTPPPTVTLPVYPPLAGFTDTLLDQLDTNINITKLTYEVNQSSFSPVDPATKNANPTYTKTLGFYNAVKDILVKSDYLTPTSYKRINSTVFVREKENFAKATKDTDNELGQIANNLAVAASKILYVLNKTGINQNVKDAVITSIDTLSVTPTQARIKALETAKENEAAKSQRIIENAATTYEAAEKPNRDAAVKALQQVKNTFKAPQNVKSPDDVKSEIAKIMGAVETLKTSDEYSQDYLSFNKRLETLQNSLPASNDVFQPRDDLRLKTVDEVKLAYVAKWKEANGLLGAAKNLADALVNLVNSLSKTTQDAEAENVKKLLTSIEENAKEALAFAETEPQRIARLAREQAAREEAERKAREEAERQRRAVETEEGKLVKFFNWLNMDTSGDKKMFFTTSLTALQQLDDYIRTTINNDNAKLNKFTDLRDTYLFAQLPFLYKTNPLDTSNTLFLGRLEDDSHFIAPQDEVYRSLYVQGADLQVVKNTYRLFAQIFTHWGLPTQTIYEKEFTDIIVNNYEKALPRQQPNFWQRDFSNKSNSVDVSMISKKQPSVYPKEGVISKSYLGWIDASCWMDASYVTLFSIPQNTWTTEIFRTKNILRPQIVLMFPDGTEKSVTEADVTICSDDKMRKLHSDLLDDIIDIQKPEEGKKELCRSKANWYKTFGCVSDPAINADESPDIVFSSLINLYQLQNTISFDPTKGSDKPDNNITVPPTTTSVFVKKVLTRDDFDVWKPTFQAKGIDAWKVDEKSTNYQLAGLIFYSGGHYNARVYDFIKKDWLFVDNYYNQVQWEGGGTKPEWFTFSRSYVLSHVIYFSNTEIANLERKYRAAQVPVITITPTVVWTPSVDAFEGKNLDDANKWITNARTAYDGSTNAEKRAWATNLKLLQPDGIFITAFVVDEPVKGAFVISSALWNDDTRRKALGYAYQKFLDWLQPMAFLNSDSLQADMQKALVAAQITEKPAPFFINGMNALQIDYVPSDVAKRDRLKQDLLEKTRTQARSRDYWQHRLRVFLVQNQINVQDLRK